MKKHDNEKGFVLILVLMLIAAMTAIGTAALMTTNTDILIARNEKESKMAFYLAETGIEEAIGRMGLSQKETLGRFMGEKIAQRNSRVGLDRIPNTPDDSPVFDGSDNSKFNSLGLNVPDIGGKYDVTITYAREGAETWCNSDPAPPGNCDNEIVLYGKDFNFSEYGVPANGFIPVYRIESTGKTRFGTEAKLSAYVTPTTLNALPPAGDVYSNTKVSVQGDGAGIDGNVATGDISADAVQNCTGDCNRVNYTGGAVAMDTYLGVDIASVPSYADSPSPYYQTGDNTVNYHPGSGDMSEWGHMCSDSTVDMDAHICDNDSKITYIGNSGAGVASIAAGSTGRGLLVITGDVKLAGDLQWEGAIYIMGSLSGNGNITLFGTLMADKAVGFTGSIFVHGSTEIASSAMSMLGVPKYLRWKRL